MEIRTRAIVRGDRVRVCMARRHVLGDWQLSQGFEATYISGPSGPGDVFVLEVAGGEGGVASGTPPVRVEVNANSSEFVGLTFAPSPEDRAATLNDRTPF